MKPHIFREPVVNAVMEVLSGEWPLGARAVHAKLKGGHDVTYAALYKKLNQLSELKILDKHGGKYEISSDWIHDVHDFAELFLSRQSAAVTPQEVFEMKTDAKLMTFPNILELDAWFLKMTALAERRLPKEIAIPMHYRHNWWPLIYTYEEDAATKEKRERYYFLCAGSTPVDRWCCELEKKMGFNIRWGVPCAETHDVQVFGDLVFQIFIPNETMAKLEQLYTSVKSISEFDITKLLKLFSEKRNANVIIIKDGNTADSVRRQTLERFRKKIRQNLPRKARQ